MSGGDEQDTDPYLSLLNVYKTCVKKLNWSLKEIDETDFELLLDFLFSGDSDPHTRVINGKTFSRAVSPPAWL